MLEHVPVMKDEVVQYLMTDKHGIYIDATFGRGGHSALILDALGNDGRLLAFDKDGEAVAFGKAVWREEPRFSIVQSSFANLLTEVEGRDWFEKVSGIVFDLGVSSPQLEECKRGFSFRESGPLDMRMDQRKGPSASDWLNMATESEISDVLWRFGEERFSRRIARAIIARRAESPLIDTLTLAEVISKVAPRDKSGKHPATRSFQAIRIFINKELEDLAIGLTEGLSVLRPGGRMVVISFHSLEDRMVKHFFRKEAGLEEDVHLPFPIPKNVKLKLLGKYKPTETELSENRRARSAIMRVVEKI